MNNIDEHQIKQRIKSIIGTYRSLGLVSDTDLRINEVVEKDGIFEIIGEYKYRSLYPNDPGERGIFNIKLDKNLQHKNVKITPDQNP